MRPFFGPFLMAFSSCLTLLGYECVRSASNTLFKMDYGVGALPWVMALVPVGVFLSVLAYGATLSQFGPRRTLTATFLVSSVLMILSYWGIDQHLKPASVFLYLIKEAYIVLLVEQFWSFVNSTLPLKYARRLNGPIIGISSIGAVGGAALVHQLSVPLGTPGLILVAALTLIPATLFSEVAFQISGQPKVDSPHRGPLNLSLLKDSALLRRLFLVVILTQFVSAALGLAFETQTQLAFPERDLQTAYSGGFYAKLNAVAALFQFVVTPLLLTKLPLSIVLCSLPMLFAGLGIWIGASPGLEAASFAFFIFKVAEYSVFKAGKEILYIPLSFDARYRSKEVIDAFGYRFGKGGASLFLGILQGAGVVLGPLLGWITSLSALLWFGGMVRVFRAK